MGWWRNSSCPSGHWTRVSYLQVVTSLTRLPNLLFPFCVCILHPVSARYSPFICCFWFSESKTLVNIINLFTLGRALLFFFFLERQNKLLFKIKFRWIFVFCSVKSFMTEVSSYRYLIRDTKANVCSYFIAAVHLMAPFVYIWEITLWLEYAWMEFYRHSI